MGDSIVMWRANLLTLVGYYYGGRESVLFMVIIRPRFIVVFME